MQYDMPYLPVEGKTYSLFGKIETTAGYYHLIEEMADTVLKKFNSPELVLDVIRKSTGKKHFLKKISLAAETPEIISFIVHLLNNSLRDYTENVDFHLKNLSIWKFRDRRLYTTREQYHLFMLEIELTNRIFAREFRNSSKKIALLPYCLRDFNADCKSRPGDLDYRCGHCSKNCYQDHSTRILEQHNIDAYIWMGADLKKIAKVATVRNTPPGILGIACIPELVRGMRRCLRYGIPVAGIPLDANRCIRWMGSVNPNSVNLEQLEKLVS
jgi:hypothetical protein